MILELLYRYHAFVCMYEGSSCKTVRARIRTSPQRDQRPVLDRVHVAVLIDGIKIVVDGKRQAVKIGEPFAARVLDDLLAITVQQTGNGGVRLAVGELRERKLRLTGDANVKDALFFE